MFPSFWAVLLTLTALAVLPGFGSGCKTAPKRTTPELSELQGRKVALIEIEGEATARKVVQAALVNQLIRRGTFELVSKQHVQEARTHFEQDPADWKGIAKRAGAEFALRAKVLEFDTTAQEGHSSEEIQDSQWERERGEKTRKNLYPVKSLSGKVRVQLEFVDLNDPDGAWGTRSAVAEHQDTVTMEAKKEAIHLPPRLRFLESLCNQAFQKFFEEYR